MSWQLQIRRAGVGIMLALLTAGCSAPQRTSGEAPQGTGAALRASANDPQTHAAASGTPAAPVAPVHTAGPANPLPHRAGAHTARITPPGSPAQSQFRPRLGVYAKGMPRSYRPAGQFGAAVGKQPGIVLFYSGFGEHFPASFARQAHAHGAVPLDQIQPTGVSIGQIAAGRYDAYLKSYADEVRAYHHRVIIGFAHEMNGSWYPWGWTHVRPHTWVRAWRRLVTDFRSQHADNVTWLWTISRVLDQGPVRSFWPGASYVNWVGIDGYYTEAQDTFSNVFVRMMHIVHQFTQDPILISESAIGQRAGQARKIPNLLAGVIRYHLRGLVWFDVAQHGGLSKQDWRLEGHPSALAAFRKADPGFA
jgi:Glycosyl hydrolase family 26